MEPMQKHQSQAIIYRLKQMQSAPGNSRELLIDRGHGPFPQTRWRLKPSA
jgi:hypothetical protein